jgi:hypothetical protein
MRRLLGAQYVGKLNADVMHAWLSGTFAGKVLMGRDELTSAAAKGSDKAGPEKADLAQICRISGGCLRIAEQSSRADLFGRIAMQSPFFQSK